MQEHYQPRDINFSTEQVIWILEYLPMLIEGLWPSDPQGTGYTDVAMGSKSRSRHAPFETPCQIAAEIEVRLKKLGTDRHLVEDRYTNMIPEEMIAQKLGVHPEEVYKRLDSALKYISRWWRKRMSYPGWKKQGRYRVSNHKGVGG